MYLIADGFTGWVTVEYAVKGAPPLPVKDGKRIITVPKSGIVRTSSPQEFGVINLRFYYVDGEAKRAPIAWPASKHGADPNAASQRHPAAVVLGFTTGDAKLETGVHVFERFYVGRGPAPEPPDWK